MTCTLRFRGEYGFGWWEIIGPTGELLETRVSSEWEAWRIAVKLGYCVIGA